MVGLLLGTGGIVAVDQFGRTVLHQFCCLWALSASPWAVVVCPQSHPQHCPRPGYVQLKGNGRRALSRDCQTLYGLPCLPINIRASI